MRVFSEHLARWHLPPSVPSSAIKAMAIAADGSSHLLLLTHGAAQLLSFSARGAESTHAWLPFDLGKEGREVMGGAALHALPSSAGGGLLLHLPSASPRISLTHLSPEPSPEPIAKRPPGTRTSSTPSTSMVSQPRPPAA